MSDSVDTPVEQKSYPSKIWYVGHFFLWIITGLVCYLIWKDKNKEAARKHLIHSIWIGLIPEIFVWVVLFSSFGLLI